MGGGKGALSGRTGESFTRLVDNAAAAERNKTPGEGASSGRPGAQSKLPECNEASGWNQRAGDVGRAFPKKVHGWRGSQDQLLALQEAEAAARHSWLEIQGRREARQSELVKDALALESQARR